MKMRDRITRHLNLRFRDELIREMHHRFGIAVESNWSLFAGRLVTTRIDGQDFTPEQHAYLAAWSAGFDRAMCIVSGFRGDRQESE